MDGDFGEAALRQRYGEQSAIVRGKIQRRLDRHARDFIALSPFIVVATADPAGGSDASPRGDPPGFVRVLDDTTLLIPDRPGNNRIDTYSNLIARPGIGILFVVPGIDETLRVNGRARVVLDDPRLAASEIGGKLPRGGLIVAIDEVFFHCGKALKRAKLWAAETQVKRSTFPTLGRIIADQTRLVDAAAADKVMEASYRDRLY